MTTKLHDHVFLCLSIKINKDIATKDHIIVGLVESKAVVHKIDPFELKFFSVLGADAYKLRMSFAAQKIVVL